MHPCVISAYAGIGRALSNCVRIVKSQLIGAALVFKGVAEGA